MKKSRYFIKTFGCQMNESDSEKIAAFLEMHKLKPAKNINEADLVIFNTCGVRQSAEDRVYGQINNIRSGKREVRSEKIIIVTGCLAKRKDVQRRLKGKVDLFFPINDFKTFENWIIENSLKIVNCKLKISAQKNSSLNKESIAYLSINPKYTNIYQAYVPIMTGCNNFCSYCVVPYARGREVSRPAMEIVNEIKCLVKKGYKEIILLGQNVNSYKSVISNSKLVIRKNNPNYKLPITNYLNFSQLLRKINKLPGNFWIHFLTSHPKDMSDELIETIARSKKVCEYIHLPIQAGDDEILQRMNRKYTAKHYLGLINKIRKTFAKIRGKFAPISVTTDIIVGFPGETRKQFMKTAEVMKKAKYDMVYFGQYSSRPGTAAWNMKDNVLKKEKERREKYLNEILKKTALENNKKYVGKVIEILTTHCKAPNSTGNLSRERLLKEKGSAIEYFGRTRTMKNVKFSLLTPTLSSGRRGSNLVGKFVKVKITKANIWNLEGIASGL